ncbi:thiamine pyrophosphate-binding protein [Paenibacillus sp. GCM10023248]|uniref:thiamine pyrophosphate-binding protein n=1 Tax=unclassified Paenibacillus TaxID=185978 RepID=UPI002378E21B|nr:thiamine pyrophosphate-binding protein [Paenibacillus sp. MAHUQ-63]MDD9270528.1 thiamine pyrophosphate-binding protein [Paenibacillus sp. MAHUQ-63]
MLTTADNHSSKRVTPTQQPYTVAELILEQLSILGVERIYGVVGDAIFGLMDAIAKHKTISFIAVRHESVASLMASAEAKLTGRLGVCISQMGPGLANLLNGLGDAYLDKAPVLAISGQAPLRKIGTFYKQYINQQVLADALAPYSQLIVHPDAVIDALKQAVLTSCLHRTVSHLSIPADLFAMATTAQPFERPSNPTLLPGTETVQQILSLISTAKQPMILVGDAAQAAQTSIQTFAEIWGCGIALSYGATGAIPDNNPWLLGWLGEGGNPSLTHLFQKADVILVIESSWWPDGDVPHTAQVIQIAKHQDDIGIAVPVDIGCIGDPAKIMPQLIAGLQGHLPNQAWLDQVRAGKQRWSEQTDKERNQSSSPLHPANVIHLMEQHLDDDAIVALDEGDATLWFLRNFRPGHQRVLLSSRWRTMGFGLPAAMSAKLCSPDKQVICITGDGGLGMVMADLITAAQYQLAITVVVYNNGTLQMERDKMFLKGLQPEGTELTNPDFARVAEACGWDGYTIRNSDEFNEAFLQSRSSSKPVLLDVKIGRIPFPEFPKQPS